MATKRAAPSRGPPRVVRPRPIPGPPPVGWQGTYQTRMGPAYRHSTRKPASNRFRKRAGKAQTRAKQVSELGAAVYMSPFGKGTTPPPNPKSLGNSLTVNDVQRGSVQTGTGNGVILLFSPSNRGVVQVMAWNATTGAGIPASDGLSPLYKYVASDAPISTKPLRAGIRLCNKNPSTSRDGAVQILNTSSPVPLVWTTTTGCDLTVASVEGLAFMVTSNNSTRQYSQESLATGLNEIVAFPATQASYNSYGTPFNSLASCAGLQAQFAASVADQAMSNIIILFEQTASIQNVSIESCIQSAMRHAENTLLGGLQKQTPLGSERLQQAVHTGATANGAGLVQSHSHPLYAGAAGMNF